MSALPRPFLVTLRDLTFFSARSIPTRFSRPVIAPAPNPCFAVVCRICSVLKSFTPNRFLSASPCRIGRRLRADEQWRSNRNSYPKFWRNHSLAEGAACRKGHEFCSGSCAGIAGVSAASSKHDQLGTAGHNHKRWHRAADNYCAHYDRRFCSNEHLRRTGRPWEQLHGASNFHPTAQGSRTRTLSIADNASGVRRS